MFIERLEKTLKAKGTNLNKMSKEIGIAQSPTSRWKKGSLPSVDALIKICEYLNVTSDYLLELDDNPVPERANNLTELEQEFLENYRALDPRAQEFLFEMAAREAEKIKQQEKSLSSKIS